MLDADGSPAGGPITFGLTSGQAFRLQQIDLADGSGTVEETFSLDGIIDATGSLVDFETFVTSAAFATAELASLTITAVGGSPIGDGAYSLDNIA